MQTAQGKFVRKLTIAGTAYTGFEMREATLEDMTLAEIEASKFGGGVHTPIMFNTQMLLLQLTKLTTDDGKEFTGALTFNMVKDIAPANYRALRDKQAELDALGEAE